MDKFQRRINIVNLTVAILALVIAAPGAYVQVNQYLESRNQKEKTVINDYSPPEYNTTQAIVANECSGSIASPRFDAYRCFQKNLIYDPCFLQEVSTDKQSYLYCPEDIKQSEQDIILSVSTENFKRNKFEPTLNIKDFNPWLIKFDKNISCRLVTGAPGLAYNTKGNIYSCNSDEYVSVTTGTIRDGKYYFECKYKDQTIFKECFAQTVIY